MPPRMAEKPAEKPGPSALAAATVQSATASEVHRHQSRAPRSENSTSESPVAIDEQVPCQVTGVKNAVSSAKKSVGRRKRQALVPAAYFLIPAIILHKSWGSQFWLQPALRRRLPLGRLVHRSKKPPKKAAAGKIARPTINARCCDREKYAALDGESAPRGLTPRGARSPGPRASPAAPVDSSPPAPPPRTAPGRRGRSPGRSRSRDTARTT